MSEEHQVNLFARYEQRLLSGGASKSQVIPAVVITGFLGSGKTTLVHHILRNRGDLRIAVLVNEVGQLDVDSQLVNAKQGNAALGLAAVDLSGGCVCCSRAEELTAALKRLRAPPGGGPGAAAAASSSGPCDYLLVETSGAADAGPLAEALLASGFRLDAVVAVVDAEAGRDALQHPVALAQVSCADVVVLNKCDLLAPGLGPGGVGGGGGLGVLADMEDLLAEMAPGVRLIRARYGEVPLAAVLDVESVDASPAGDSGAPAAAGGGGDGAGGGGDVGGGGGGFMSHESVPSALRGAAGGGHRLTSGPLTADGMAVGSSRHTRRRGQLPPTAAAASGHSHQHPAGHHHHHHHPNPGAPGSLQVDHPGRDRDPGHAQLHSGFHTESVAVEEGPVSLVAFASFVVRRLVREPALLRSKGVLWLGERRGHRFIFHLSGRRRVEVAQEGPWEGPPASQLVFIGTDAAAMRALREAFMREVVAAEQAEAVWRVCGGSTVGGGTGGGGGGTGGGGGSVATAGSGGTEAAAVAATVGQAAMVAEPTSGVPEQREAVAFEMAAVAARFAANERLELLGCESWEVAAPAPVWQAVAPAAAAEATALAAVPQDGSGPSPAPQPEAQARPGSTSGGLVVQFTTRGSVLHGISAEELNAELQRRANASGRLLLAGVTAPGTISAVTHVRSRDRVLSLLLPCGIAEAQAQLEVLLETAEPLLRKAFAHVHNCKCDVVSAMQASS